MHNDLLLNPSKSETMTTGTRAQLGNGGIDGGVDVAGAAVSPASHVRIMGVTLDSRLSFDKHISDIVRIAFYHLRGLQHVRKFLDKKTAHTIACSLVGSRLDYCNSVLAGVSDHNIKRLQRVQNTAARTVANIGRRSSASRTMFDLHWLPVSKRIDFKVALTTFKVLTTNEPKYLRSLLKLSVPVRSLRSSDKHTLVVPLCKSALSSRAFSCYAPKLWNSLPQPIRDCITHVPGSDNYCKLSVFKSRLKTFLFNTAYDTVTI